MTKTLADMTEEERAQCVGMWCDFEATPNYVITTGIIKAGNDYDAEFADEYEVFNTVLGHELVQPEQITPRQTYPAHGTLTAHHQQGNGSTRNT